MTVIQAIIWFLVAILVLVTVHEFGHFYVARRCGVRVLRFSIGFGQVLARWHDKSGTEYALSAIPLGGYVKMLDEREGEVPEDQLHQAFNRKNVWQRIAIVLAGPVANFILAVLFFWIILLVSGERGLAPIVGEVEPGSVAAAANLEVGQEILSVDGVPTASWQDVRKQLLRRLGESGPLRFTVRYPDSPLRYESEVILQAWLRGVADPMPLEGLGVRPYIPDADAVATYLEPEGAAALAGMQENDHVVSVNGEPVDSARQWVNLVRAHPQQLLDVTVMRDGQPVGLAIRPETISENGQDVGRVGMGLPTAYWPEGMIRVREFSPIQAFVAGVDKTWETSAFVLLSVKKLIFGEIAINNLSGAITIAKVAGSEAEHGWLRFLGFLALLSVSLGVFNLLPIPVLDGGHLMYYLVEVIRGKPVSEHIQVVGYQVGLIMVVGLTVLALYNDVLKL